MNKKKFSLFQTGGGVSENVLHSFCWMYSTFNVPLDFKGVCSKRKSLDVSDPLYNSYYQWVPLYLVSNWLLATNDVPHLLVRELL